MVARGFAAAPARELAAVAVPDGFVARVAICFALLRLAEKMGSFGNFFRRKPKTPGRGGVRRDSPETPCHRPIPRFGFVRTLLRALFSIWCQQKWVRSVILSAAFAPVRRSHSESPWTTSATTPPEIGFLP